MPDEDYIVGVFDSGVGGLTVLKELIHLLPFHSFIYFADTKNCPYGPKGNDEIIRLSSKITQFLLSKGCKTIVVACNTATAAAIDHLRSNFNVPFVGMEPAVKPAALATKTNAIGVLATAGTFKGRLYKETTSKYASNINVVYKVGEGLVELVEQGKSNSEELKLLLESFVNPMLQKNIDHLVLGCTHYPFFIDVLRKILPENVSIVNPAPAVAKQAKRVLSNLENSNDNHNTIMNPFVHFYSSGDITILKTMVNELEKEDNVHFKNPEFHQIELK